MTKEVTYGEGHSPEDGGQGMWFVKTGENVEWFDTEQEAKARHDELTR